MAVQRHFRARLKMYGLVFELKNGGIDGVAPVTIEASSYGDRKTMSPADARFVVAQLRKRMSP